MPMMRNLFKTGFCFLLCSALVLSTLIPQTYAASDDCLDFVTVSDGSLPSSTNIASGSTTPIQFSLNGLTSNSSYNMRLYNVKLAGTIYTAPIVATSTSDASGKAAFTINDPKAFQELPGGLLLYLQGNFGDGSTDSVCLLDQYHPSTKGSCTITTVSQRREVNPGDANSRKECFYNFSNPANSCIEQSSTADSNMTVKVDNIKVGDEIMNNQFVTIRLSGITSDDTSGEVNNGSIATVHRVPSPTNGGYNIKVYKGIGSAITFSEVLCEATVNVSLNCANKCESNEPQTNPQGPELNEMSSFNLCDQINDTKLQNECKSCASQGNGGGDNQGGVWTAIGCIKRDPVSIAQRLIAVGLGIGGGVALIMTLAGGFILATSQGEPQKANQAKEMITNSVIGLLFVIFSVVILQFIGVTILHIPGFGENPTAQSGS